MAATASALAVPAEDAPPTDAATPAGRPRSGADVLPTDDHVVSPPGVDAGPSNEAGQLRRAPVPLCDPPFEDEATGAGDRDRDGAFEDHKAHNDRGAQGTLALAFAFPGGLPVAPDQPSDLSRGSHRRLQMVPPLERKSGKRPGGRKQRRSEDDFGPRQTPRANLPEPKVWAGRLVQAMVEVTSGVRPVTQLVRWTTTDVYAGLQRRIARTELLSQRPATGRRVGAIVRSIHVDEPADGVAEVCAVVQHGARCRAIALRLEGFDGRWQCTALQVG